jgi:formylglycine-generating enzyme required for sulfatase activity
MVGNVWNWVKDCYHSNYEGAPTNGSGWTTACLDDRRVVRGASWFSTPGEGDLRSAFRNGNSSAIGDFSLGLRVGRTLTP